MALIALTIRVDDEEAAFLDQVASQHEGILSKQGVMRLLLQQAQAFGWDPLDKPFTLGVASGSEATTSKAVKAVSSSSKRTNLKPINKCLEQQHGELIREFWATKGGSRGETAWKLLMTELTKLQQKHGDAVVAEQLHLAINGKWQGITLNRYEQFKAPKGNTPAQPEFKHPAYRDASEVLAEQDRIAQQNLEHLRRKQQEANASGGVLDGLF